MGALACPSLPERKRTGEAPILHWMPSPAAIGDAAELLQFRVDRRRDFHRAVGMRARFHERVARAAHVAVRATQRAELHERSDGRGTERLELAETFDETDRPDAIAALLRKRGRASDESRNGVLAPQLIDQLACDIVLLRIAVNRSEERRV